MWKELAIKSFNRANNPAEIKFVYLLIKITLTHSVSYWKHSCLLISFFLLNQPWLDIKTEKIKKCSQIYYQEYLRMKFNK